MRKLLLFFLIIVLCISSVALARESMIFEAILYDIDIFVNGEKMSFDSPVVLINNQTYVPLRETAEQLDCGIEWDGIMRRITINKNNSKANEIFNNLFGFPLPHTSKITNYDYFIEDEEQCFSAKIAFNEEDLEYFKSNFSDRSFPDSVREQYTDNMTFLYRQNKDYSWWDISSLSEVDYAYDWYKSGVNKWTVNVWGFIKQEAAGLYYLYVYHI